MFFSSSYLGIDLGADSIKAANLCKKGNKKIIKGLYQIENPIGKTVFNKPAEQAAIRQVLAKINKVLPSKGVVIGISSKHAMFRYVQFPLLNKKELKDAIFWEMQEFNTIFSGEFISDYEVLGKQKDSYRVLLAAVSKDIIMDYIKATGEAGLCLKALDVYPLANARVLKAQKKDGVTAIIDLGLSHNEITITGNGRIIFNRKLDFCYDDMVKSGKPEPSPLQNLICESSRIFDFYSLQSQGSQIDEIILIGKGSELYHCKDAFESYFNIHVSTGKELKFDYMSKNLNNDSHADFFSAIGFALRG